MNKLLVLLLFSFYCFGTSDACDCMPISSPDKYYCESEFAGTIKVLSSARKDDDEMYVRYFIRVEQQIRGAVIRTVDLRTAENSAMCGVTLTPGNTYFVATKRIEPNSKTLGLHSCQLYEDWTKYSPFKRWTKLQDYRKIQCA